MEAPSPRDCLLGRLAIARGLVSPDAIEDALTEQEALARRGAPVLPIGAILVSRRALTEAALAELLAVQAEGLADPAAWGQARPADGVFGLRLIAQGLATAEQVNEALRTQARLHDHGIDLRLGEILVSRGALTPTQVRDALALQDKTVLRCTRCMRAFNARSYRPGQQLACPRCSGPLAPPSHHGMPHVDGSLPDLCAADAPVASSPRPPETTSEPPVAPPGAVEHTGPRPDRPQPPPPGPARPAPAAAGGAVPRAPLDAATQQPLDRAPLPARLPASAPPIPDAAPTGGGPPRPGAGGRATAPEPAETSFGRYRLLQELGHGGMGVVYKAWDNELRRVVALKTLLPEAAPTPDDVQRFLREARAAARLRHPNIVQVHDVGSYAGRNYFTMDFIEGVSLESARKDLPARRFLEILRDVALALDCAHQAGVVHRDVKPANILLDGDGRAYVSDFGLAKEVRERGARGATRTGAVMGTPHYMSPEQSQGDIAAIGPRSDVWSLGVILYQHLAGHLPFDGPGLVDILVAIWESEPVPPSRATRGRRVHQDLETICLKCLEKERARRYPSAAEFARDLGRFLDGEPILARPISPAERLIRQTVKHKSVLVPVAAATLAVCALGTYTWQARAGAAANEARIRESETATAQAKADQEKAEADRQQAESGRKRAERAREVEQLLARPEALWREAKAVLYSAEIPLERYHEKLAAAMKLYDEAIQKDPAYGWTYESRGRVRVQIGDLAGAEQDLTQAVGLLGPNEGRAARRSLALLFLERAFDLAYHLADDDRTVLGARQKEWEEKALAELKAAAETTEWRGTQEEAQSTEHLVRGFSNLARGERDAGLRILKEGFERNRDEQCAWALALCATEADRESWLTQALAVCPRHARSLMLRGWSRWQEADLDGAIADFDLALRIAPKVTWVYANRGLVRYDQRNHDAAIADFDQALRLDPTLRSVHNSRGLARQAKGDLAGAMADLDEAIRLDPGLALSYITRSAIRIEQNELKAAIADLDTAIRLDPKLAMAYHNRGLARQKDGNLDGAIADLNEAIRLDPKLAAAYYERGYVRKQQGDQRAAIADFDDAIRQNPKFAEAFMARGAMRVEQSELKAAMADLDTAIRLDPKLAKAYYNRAIAREKDGNLDGAIADCSQTIRLDPEFAMAYYERGFVRNRQGDRRAAIADLDQAIRLDPKDADAYSLRGFARGMTGDLDGATADLDQALRLNPRHAWASWNRGRVRIQKGDFAGAAADLEHALEFAPRNWSQRAEIERTLGEIRSRGKK